MQMSHENKLSPSTSQLWNQFLKWSSLGGVVGPILFVVTFTVAGFLRPGYSPVYQAISDLGVGGNGWILNASLVILGLLMIGFAISFYRTVRPEASTGLRFVSALLIALVGVGFALAGIFPETTPMHWVVSAPLVFLGAPLAFFLTGLLLRGDRVWRGWAVYSLIASLVTIVLVAILFYTFSPSTPPGAQVGGLIERLVFIEILAWYVAFGWRLFRAQTEDRPGRYLTEMSKTKDPKRPLNRQVQARIMGLINVPMRVILGLPFPTPLSGRLMLLSYMGRKTGKAYRQPVSYVQQGDTLLTPGGGNWKWNLREGQPVQIRLRGQDVLAQPELIRDPDEIEWLLAVMIAANPGVRAFTGIPKGPEGQLDRGRLETAVKYGFRIVRWHLEKEV